MKRLSLFEKKLIEVRKAVTFNADAARELTEAAKQEQIKEGLERIDRQILSSAKDGRYRFYTGALDDVCAEARDAIVESLRERGFEVDTDRGIISWKNGVLVKKETFGKE